MIKSVAIMGMGLMGGSLGLALRERCPGITVRGYARRGEARDQALSGGFVDAVFGNAAQAVADADLVVLCTPVLSMPQMMYDIREALAPDCLVTDVGSTKQWLDTQMQGVLAERAATFIGSHPMAGSEKVGMDAARSDLYQDACVIVTPTQDACLEKAHQVKAFWELVGGVVTLMPPQEHDAVIARTSHLPHMLAALLVQTVARDARSVGDYCGPGFRDTTRIAAGSEAVWHDIVKSNAGAILTELTIFKDSVNHLCDLIRAGDFESIRKMLANSRQKREMITDL